jgi:hypothetical protein
MKLTGENRRSRRKTCPNATLSTTNPTWTDPGSNPGFRVERPATNRLNHGTPWATLIRLQFLTSHLFGVLNIYPPMPRPFE